MASAVMLTVAVYAVTEAKVTGLLLQVIVALYCPLSVSVVCGVAPVAGAVITTFAVVMVVLVTGKSAATDPEPAELLAVAPLTLKKLAPTPLRVKPAMGVKAIVAV